MRKKFRFEILVDIETHTEAAGAKCRNWTENSAMRCKNCGDEGIADEFDTEEGRKPT